MSSPKSETSRSAVAQKPRSNIYTVMLLLSLVAIITACILLYAELRKSGDWPPWTTPRIGQVEMLQPSGDVPRMEAQGWNLPARV